MGLKLKTLLLLLVSLTIWLQEMIAAPAINQASAQNKVAILQTELEHALAEDYQYAAPTYIAKAQKKYAMALKKQNAGAAYDKTNMIAQEGLDLLEQASIVATKSQHILKDVYAQRQNAMSAEATTFYPEQLNELNKKLISIAEMIEVGKEEAAIQQAEKLTKNYQKLEMYSLKKGLTAHARNAYDQAVAAKAQQYAPKTLQAAEEELQLADKVLSAGAEQASTTEQAGLARKHAQQARYQSERARQIASLAKEFELKNYTIEDQILWHDEQLDRVAQAMGLQIHFDQEHEAIMAAMLAKANALNAELQKTVEAVNAKQQEIVNVQQKYARKLSNETQHNFTRMQYEHKFEMIKKMFDRAEATVYRDENDVLIKANGFNFLVGKSNIEAENFPMVKKIIDAIGEFPHFTKIIISGHTDSTGNPALNKKLSQERADSVKALLVNIAKIPADKIETYGYGDERPVVSENQQGGRDQNRRVEIRIVN